MSKTLKDFIPNFKEKIFLNKTKRYVIFNTKNTNEGKYLEITYLDSEKRKTSIRKLETALSDIYCGPYTKQHDITPLNAPRESNCPIISK